MSVPVLARRALLALLVVLRVDTAHAHSFQPLSEADASAALEKAQNDPLAEVTERSCPASVRIINGTNGPLFNVAIPASEPGGEANEPRQEVVRVPYLPAKSSVVVSVPCPRPPVIVDGEDPAPQTSQLSVSPSGTASKLDATGIHAMLGGKDPRSQDSGVWDRATDTDGATPSLIAAILDEISGWKDFETFASALLQSPEGARELADFVLRAPERHSMAGLPLLLASKPAPRIAVVLDRWLEDSGESPASPSVAAVADRLCGADQPETIRARAWLTLLTLDPSERNRRDLLMCGTGRGLMRARLDAAKPELLGRVAERGTGEAWEVALSVMVEKKSLLAAQRVLSFTQDAKKFAAVAKAAALFVRAVPEREQLIRAVAAGAPGDLDEARTRWVQENLDELHAQATARALARQVLADVAGDKIKIGGVRRLAYARRKDAGPGALRPFRELLGDGTLALASDWAIAEAEAGKLDLVEVIDSLRRAGGSTWGPHASGCKGSPERAARCMDALEKVALTKDAFAPAFVAAALRFLVGNPSDRQAVATVTTLARLGVDPSPAVEALCNTALTTQGAKGYRDALGVDRLAIAAALDPDNACVGRKQAARVTAERWFMAETCLWLLFSLLPVASTVLLATSRFEAVRARLAKARAERGAARGKAAALARLERTSVERSLAAGVADAVRWLSGEEPDAVINWPPAAAGRALTALMVEKGAALVDRSRALIARAGESGGAASCLCELGDVMLYLVCLPGTEAPARTVRRELARGRSWLEYQRQLLAACVADGEATKVVAFVFLLATDGASITMLTSFANATLQLVPEGLADPHDLASQSTAAHGAQAVRTHRHRYELSTNTG